MSNNQEETSNSDDYPLCLRLDLVILLLLKDYIVFGLPMLIVFLTVPVFPTLPPNLTLVPIVSDRRNLRFINPSVIPTTDCKCLSSVYTSLSPPLEDESRFYLIVQSLNENKDFVGFYVFYSLCNQKICTVKSVTSPYWKVFTLSLLPSGYSRGRIMELSKRSNTVSFPFESI